MVAAANTALSATADGNQKKPGLPGFIPPGANPQQVAAALAARPAPNVLAGTGLGMGDPMKQIAPIAPAVGGGLAPAFNSGTVGENARYNALPQDNAQNAGRAAVGNVPAQAPAPSLNAPWYSPEYARAAGMSDKGGLELERMRAANAPAGLPANDPARRMLSTGTVSTGASIAPVTPPAVQPAQAVQASQSQRGDGSVTGLPAALPASAPATAQPVKLGAGAYAGPGIVRIDGGSSPLFTNMTDAAGMADNQKLMGRGAPTAQNMAAMDALVNRSTAEGAQAVQRAQFNDQVAQAKAINALPTADSNPNDLRSPTNIAARNQSMDMRIKSGESPQAYEVRMRSIQEAQRLAAMQGNAMADRGLRRDELSANQQMSQSRLGIDQQQLGLRQQQVGNELATGAQGRDAKGMEIAAAKQLQTLQAQLLDPKSTDTKRTEVAKLIAGLSGKTEKPDQWDSVVVNGGTDALGNKIGGSAALFNKTTGEYKAVGAPVSSGATAIGQKYEVGQTVVRGDGAKVRVLAVDESGKPTKFQPI